MSTSDGLYRAACVSRATRALAFADLGALLEQARRNDRRDGISWLLVYDADHAVLRGAMLRHHVGYRATVYQALRLFCDAHARPA
jgi:hypothetical protein